MESLRTEETGMSRAEMWVYLGLFGMVSIIFICVAMVAIFSPDLLRH